MPLSEFSAVFLVVRCHVGRATGLMLAVASGSGGPSAEPAPETEVKGSGERPLAEAAALEIDPEKLTESETHPKLGEIYVWRGKTYKTKCGNGVNSSHAI